MVHDSWKKFHIGMYEDCSLINLKYFISNLNECNTYKMYRLLKICFKENAFESHYTLNF